MLLRLNPFSFIQAPPKPIPKTIDNQRVYDETTVDPNDEEVMLEVLNEFG